HESSTAQNIRNKPVMGHFGQIKDLVQRFKPDQILLALPRHQYVDLDRILEFLKEEMVDIQLVPDIHEYVTLGCEIEDFDGLPIVNINDSPLTGWGGVIKRMTDILLCAMGLILISPLLLFIAVLVKLTSRGPIFYRQERMGLDGRTFQMLKFRS